MKCADPTATVRVVLAIGCGSASLDGPLLDAAQVAAKFGLRRGWVYEHATELGAMRIGKGPKAPLRFDPEIVECALADPKHLSYPKRCATPDCRMALSSHNRAGLFGSFCRPCAERLAEFRAELENGWRPENGSRAIAGTRGLADKCYSDP